MEISPELARKLLWKREILFQKRRDVNKASGREEGTGAAPRPAGYVEDDPELSAYNYEYVEMTAPENAEMDRVIREILAQAPPAGASRMARLDDSNLWLWGGPTPSWGGSMAKDTLVRWAKYFDIRNGVYVYGPTNDEMLALHGGFERLLCQVNSNCRTAGAQEGTNAENAEALSKLSLKYPNIKGAMLDDVAAGYGRLVLPDDFEAVNKALKKHNKALKMYGVMYAHELNKLDFSEVAPYFDVFNLWFWYKEEILEYDEKIRQYMKLFPGKPILQGIFLHDYGTSDAGAPPELLIYQLDRAREYMAKGIVEGVVLLGDREIKKWPATAAAIKEYLAKQ